MLIFFGYRKPYFFFPRLARARLVLQFTFSLSLSLSKCPKPHHPFQRCRSKKAFTILCPYACGRISTKVRHCVQLPLVATSLSTAQQRYFVPHTLAFFPPLTKSNTILPLRSVYPIANTQKGTFIKS